MCMVAHSADSIQDTLSSLQHVIGSEVVSKVRYQVDSEAGDVEAHFSRAATTARPRLKRFERSSITIFPVAKKRMSKKK